MAKPHAKLRGAMVASDIDESYLARKLLLRDALSRVELVERKIYELRMHSDQEEQEEESP